jgi:WXG100 family type VII secretion target
MTLRVNLEDMVGSALHVSGQGEDLAAAHLESDNQIESAHAGWQGTSAAAMSSKIAAWAQTSAQILGRVADHAQGLHMSAQAFADNEQENSQVLAELGTVAAQAVGGAGTD